MIPKWRTGEYGVWRACERLSIRPPDVKADWDANSVWTQSLILAFDQIRQYEEAEEFSHLCQARML